MENQQEKQAEVKAAAPTAAATQATAAAPKKHAPSRKKLIYGCATAFGCSAIVVVGLIFVFLGVGGEGDSQIAAMLGVRQGEVINLLILIVNLFFGLLSFVSFIAMIIGFFRVATTKKGDKEHKKKSFAFAFASMAILVTLVIIWISAYFFLDQKRVPAAPPTFATEPAVTTGLTAPATIKFDATGIVDLVRFTPLTYKWNFGDGQTASGNPQTHRYTDKGASDGRFNVTLDITATHKTTGEEISQSFSKILTIANVEAQAVISAKPLKGDAPLEVSFNASDSIDPDGEIVAYEWDFDEDGDFDDAEGAQVSHVFEKIGAYNAKLRVTDSQGQTAVAEQVVEVTEPIVPKPIIEVEGVDGNVLYVNEQYTFSAAKSSSPGGDIKSYEWNFGDESGKKTTRTLSYTYEATGTFEVFLKITDAGGGVGEVSKRYRVANRSQAPRAVIATEPALNANNIIEGKVPLAVVFNANTSTDSDGDIVDFSWDFDGDGAVDNANEQAAHIFEEAGIHEVILIVTDSEGNENSASAFIHAQSQGISAKASAEPLAGEIPLTVNFDASGSSFSEGDIVSFEWDFGDETPKRVDTATVTHRYTEQGTFTATVTAMGSDGSTASAELTINVRPISVSACFEPSAEEGTAPLTVTFNPTCSTGNISRFSWDFGGKGTSRDRRPEFTFEEDGDYEVKLEVSDNQNVIDTFTKTIHVNK